MIGSVTLSLDNMKTLAQSCEPARLYNGEKKTGKILVTECVVEELQELGRKLSGCYPARRGSAYSLSQDEEHQLQCEEHQAQAQHLLSQGTDHCPVYEGGGVPYPLVNCIPEGGLDRRPSYS